MLSLPTHACLTTPNPRLPTMAGTHRCSSYPCFELAGKEHRAVDPIDWQCARAPGGDARAAGRPWSRSAVWSQRVLPPLVAAVWRLPLHDLVVWLCYMAVSMASADAWSSLGAVEAAVRGFIKRQERVAEALRFWLSRDVPNDRSVACCARV